MKKIISMALLAAMLLSCFAGCAMQKGEIDVENYVEEAVAADVAATVTAPAANWKNGLTAWDGSVDSTWYDSTKTTLEIADGADLRAFLVEVRVNKNTFKNKKIVLTNDIYLGGKEWAPIISNSVDGSGNAKDDTTVFFAGEFDGQGHTIGGFTMTINDDVVDTNLKDSTKGYTSTDVVSSHALLGSAGDGASFHDLKVVEATYNVSHETGSTSVLGGIVAEANNKITFENVYISGSIKDTGAKAIGTVGGILGKAKGGGPATFTNCVSNVKIEGKGSAIGGIVGNVNGGVTKFTATDCEVNAAITGGNQTGGIVGNFSAASNAGKNAISITNCKVTGDINSGSGSGGIVGTVGKDMATLQIKNCEYTGNINKGKNISSVGGILGTMGVFSGETTLKVSGVSEVSKATTLIEGCKVNGLIHANEKSGGIVGYAGQCINGLVVKDCTVNATMVMKRMTGGVIGYVDTKMSVYVINCDVDGSLAGERTCGGLIGTLNTKSEKACVIRDCDVNADLIFTLKDTKNNNVGGLIGKVEAPVDVSNCHVNSNMTTTYTVGDKLESDLITGVGGLIGRILTAKTVTFNDCSVDGEFTFKYETYKLDSKLYAGRLIGSMSTASASADITGTNVVYGENVIVSPDLKVNFVGAASNFAYDSEGCLPDVAPIGYQTRENADGTYDLRFVFGMQDDLYDALRVTANIRYVDAGGVFDEKYCTLYIENVYSSVKDETNKKYEAAAFGYDYIYTVVISGVPAGFTAEAENLEVIFSAFGVVVGEDAEQNPTYTYSMACTTIYGATLANTSAQDAGIIAESMSAILDSKYTAEGAIHVDGTTPDMTVSYGTWSTKAAATECEGGYADGTLTIPTHYYLDNTKVVIKNHQTMNLTYNFVVEEEGYYDLCIYIRMKGNDLEKGSGDCDGSYNRLYLMMIDWKGGDDAYKVHLQFDQVKDFKDDSAGAYIDDFQVYLTAGEHTITFKTDAGIDGGSYLHIRGMYLALAE